MRNNACESDQRYDHSGFSISEYSFQKDNKILDVLKSKSSFYYYVPEPKIKK